MGHIIRIRIKSSHERQARCWEDAGQSCHLFHYYQVKWDENFNLISIIGMKLELALKAVAPRLLLMLILISSQ